MEKDQVFGDYAAFLNALLPQAVGFLFHDRHGRLFWHDNSPDTSQLNDEYHATLRRMLAHGELPNDQGRIPLRDCTAYLLRLVSDQGKVLGILTALATKDMGGMPYAFCRDMLQPALRSLTRELSLRVHLLDANSQLTHRGGEHEFLKALSDTARAGNSCEESLRGVLDLTLRHLLLDGAVFLAPAHALRVRTGEDPIEFAEAELLLDELRDMVAEHEDSTAEILATRPEPDPRERTRSWPILANGRQLVGILVLSRPVNMAKISRHSASLASFVVSTIEHVLERGFDPLTGLINWPGFESALETACQATVEDYALMYMDIDQLHVVNDTLGRQTGDEILRQLATILKELLPDQTITRVTGDSFAALLNRIDLDTAHKLGQQICARLKNLDYARGASKFRPTVSIGVAPMLPSDDGLRSALVPAQVACQAAKERGRGRCEIYQSSDASIVQRFEDIHLVGSIRNAIEGGRLFLHVQRIVALQDQPRASHYEVLVRMLDADGNALEPADFLGAAERYQLMQELDRWVVSRVFDTLAESGTDADGQPLHFAVNLSGQSLGNDQFLDFVRSELNRTGVTPDRLCFEITETVAVANLQKAQLFMEELKKMGCQFSLDDFGTGLSSFAYLKLFPVDKLKIDGSFIHDFADNEVSRSMVTAIAEIAKVMHIETVAEYVQDEATIELLRDIGIDWAQGFHVGEPFRLRELVGSGTVTDMAKLVDIDSTILTGLHPAAG